VEIAMEIANIHEAKTQLSRLVERALEGEVVIIARRQADGPFRPDS
jgi:antitoxin (DNA-binding transcriptional repressor) of toxin-antitoxin stability system